MDLEVSMQTVLLLGCKAFGVAPNTICQSFCTALGTLTCHKACSARLQSSQGECSAHGAVMQHSLSGCRGAVGRQGGLQNGLQLRV